MRSNIGDCFEVPPAHGTRNPLAVRNLQFIRRPDPHDAVQCLAA
jgi:hypothetical protein